MHIIRYLSALAGDDAAMKSIFDHVRNIAICALMIAASRLILSQAPPFDDSLLMIISGAAVAVVAWFLAFLNAFQGLKKAAAIDYRLARYVTYIAVNLIGPVTLIAMVLMRPFPKM